MVEKDMRDYISIEEGRKKNVNYLINKLIEDRRIKNKNIERELEMLNKEQMETENFPSKDFEELGTATVVQKPIEIERKEIIETAVQYDIQTNIPFSVPLIQNFIATEEYPRIENLISEEKKKLSINLLKEIKIKVNKRLSQMNTTSSQLERITRDLAPISKYCTFIETFALKILDQGRLQVSLHSESYKNYSLLFSSLMSKDLFTYFRVILFTKKGSANSIKGMYKIYFGVLKHCGYIEEAWFFIASVLNVKPNELSVYVVEAFILILGEDMLKSCGDEFRKLLKYIGAVYLNLIESEACRVRVGNFIKKYIC